MCRVVGGLGFWSARHRLDDWRFALVPLRPRRPCQSVCLPSPLWLLALPRVSRPSLSALAAVGAGSRSCAASSSACLTVGLPALSFLMAGARSCVAPSSDLSVYLPASTASVAGACSCAASSSALAVGLPVFGFRLDGWRSLFVLSSSSSLPLFCLLILPVVLDVLSSFLVVHVSMSIFPSVLIICCYR